MSERDIKGALRLAGMAACVALVLLGPVVAHEYLRIAMQVFGIILLMRLAIDEGRARERRGA